jgi:Ca-activated chloride channel family protein
VGRFCTAALAFFTCVVFAQESTFSVNVQLVRVVANVKGPQGAPVTGLEKADFTVLDNGVKQEIALFERHTEQPLSISLLIDTSGSTAKDLRYEVDSVGRFLRAVFAAGNPKDAVSLYSFNWQIRQEVDFSRKLSSFQKALKSLKGEAGTSLYDAIYLSAENAEGRNGRNVIVLITDGGDTVSSKNYHDALRAVHAADAVLYAILVVPINNDAGRNVGGENALTGLARSTGGRVFAPGLADLDSVFDDILRDLRTQYVIGYYPKNIPATNDPFHKLLVKTARADLQVSSRTGYYGEFNSSDSRSRK